MVLAAGIGAGFAIFWIGVRALGAFLSGLSSHDPETLAIAAGILTFVALMAGLIPALRASRTDPAFVLRYQ